MPVSEQILLEVEARASTGALTDTNRDIQGLTQQVGRLTLLLGDLATAGRNAELVIKTLGGSFRDLDAYATSTAGSLGRAVDANKAISLSTREAIGAIGDYRIVLGQLGRDLLAASAAQDALNLSQRAGAASSAGAGAAARTAGGSGGSGGGGLYAAATGPAGLAAATVAAALIVPAAMAISQDTAVRQTVATTSIDPADIARFNAIFKSIAAEPGQQFNLGQINQAGYNVASAGGPFQNAATLKAVTEASLTYAEGSGIDPATAAHNIVAALSASRLDPAKFATQIADILTETTASAIAPPQDVANAIGTFGGRAFSIGLGLAQPTAAFATLTQGGISAQQSAQDINALLASIIHPTRGQRTAFSTAGIADPLKYLQENGLQGFLGRVNAVAGGDPKALTALFSNQAAVEAGLGLTGKNFSAFSANTALNQNAAGASARAAAIVSGGPEAQATAAMNELKIHLNDLGNLIVTSFEPGIVNTAKALNDNLIPAIGGAAGKLGHFLDIAIQGDKDLAKAIGDFLHRLGIGGGGSSSESPFPVLANGKQGPVAPPLPPQARTTTNDPSVVFGRPFAPPIGPRLPGLGEPGASGPIVLTGTDAVGAAARALFGGALASRPGLPGFTGPVAPDTATAAQGQLAASRVANQAAVQATLQAAADAKTRSALDDLANRSTGRGGSKSPAQLDLLAQLQVDIGNAASLPKIQADANAIKASYNAMTNLSKQQKEALDQQVQAQVNAVVSQRAAADAAKKQQAAADAAKLGAALFAAASDQAALQVTQASIAFNKSVTGGNLQQELRASAAFTRAQLTQAGVRDFGQPATVLRADQLTITADQASRDAGLRAADAAKVKADADKRAAILAQQLAEQAQLQLTTAQLSLSAAERGTSLHAQLAALDTLTNLQLQQAAKADKGDPTKLKIDDATIAANAADQARTLRLNASQKEYQNLQDRLTLAQLDGKGISQAQQAILKDMRSHPELFSATQIAIQAAEFKQGNAAVNQSPVTPFTANQAGLGQLIAGIGQTAVRFGSGRDPRDEALARKDAEIARLEQQVSRLLSRIATAGERTARAVEKAPQRGIRG